MFKWNGEIEITPDLAEIKNFCVKNQEESFLLSSFKKMVQFLNLADLNEAAKQIGQQVKSGSKKELLSYLQKEAGSEVEFAWRTSCFFAIGQIKTDDMGKVIKTLSDAKFL